LVALRSFSAGAVSSEVAELRSKALSSGMFEMSLLDAPEQTPCRAIDTTKFIRKRVEDQWQGRCAARAAWLGS